MLIFLIGPMGAGKTTIGKLLAQELHLPFFDIDKLIEQKEKISLALIFRKKSEAYFREVESLILQNLLTQPYGIVSTGGGIILKKENRKLLSLQKNVIYLKTSVSSQMTRLKNDNTRPLLQENMLQTLNAMQKTRDPLYSEITNAIINTDEQSIETILIALKKLLVSTHLMH